jgi:hypothetical protein
MEKTEHFKKLEQLNSLAILMTEKSLNELDDESKSYLETDTGEDVNNALDILGAMEQLKYLKDEGDINYRLAEVAFDIDISVDDIREFCAILECEERDTEIREKKERIENNKVIKRLTDECGFTRIEQRQYRHDWHFQFNMPDGLLVTGRVHRVSPRWWSPIKVWTKWKQNGVTKTQCWQTAQLSGSDLPLEFPMDWMGEYCGDDPDLTREAYAYLMAYYLIENNLPTTDLVVPKGVV